MRTTRKILVTIALAVAAGFGLAGCATPTEGTAVMAEGWHTAPETAAAPSTTQPPTPTVQPTTPRPTPTPSPTPPSALGTSIGFTQNGVRHGTGTATVWTAEWTQINPASYDDAPATNGAFLIIDVSVQGVTGTVSTNPYDWTLKDALGHSYTYAWSGKEPILHDSGPLAAGEISRGFLTFDVPQGPMTVSIGTGVQWAITAGS